MYPRTKSVGFGDDARFYARFLAVFLCWRLADRRGLRRLDP
jgi:hypothetical protein